MTKAEIITKAQLYLDDTSELSSDEFSDLFDKMYRKVNADRPWEGTKAEHTGTTSTSVDYIALPSDFLYLTANNNETDASFEAGRPVVFVGTEYTPFNVVSWSDRRQYRNQNGYCYIDYGNSRLVFTKQPTQTKAIEFDYHKQMPALASGESPWFPAEFHDMLYHYMVSDDFMIQHSDKAKSYQKENWGAAEDIKERMAYWNAQLVQM